MSVWRPGKHREKDDEWDDASLADLFDPPRTVARQPVTGGPPWDSPQCEARIYLLSQVTGAKRYYHRCNYAAGHEPDWHNWERSDAPGDWDPKLYVSGSSPADYFPPSAQVPVADVAAGHSATWETKGRLPGGLGLAYTMMDIPPHVPDPAGVPSSVNPPTGSGTHPYPLADLGAAIAALGHEPEPFTARFEPSQVLDRARAELTTDPTFRWALRHAPLDAIADLFNPEASDG